LYAGGGQKRDKCVHTTVTYTSNPKLTGDRYIWFTNAGGSPTSTFATERHDLHRLRRGALNPFFSKQSVVKLEPVIHEKTELLCAGLRSLQHERVPVEFGAAYMSFALDTISHYAFGESECWNCLLEPGFSKEWKEAIVALFENATLVRYVPWILIPLLQIPYRWVMAVHKNMGMFCKSAAVSPLQHIFGTKH